MRAFVIRTPRRYVLLPSRPRLYRETSARWFSAERADVDDRLTLQDVAETLTWHRSGSSNASKPRSTGKP